MIKAISIAPDFAVAYWNLGMVYAKGLEKRKSARQAFQRYLQLQPNGDRAMQIRQWLAAN